MLPEAFSWISVLYYFCFVLLIGFAGFVLLAGGRPSRAPLRRLFLVLTACLLVWQITLFWIARTPLAPLQLWLSRLNFAAMTPVPYLCVNFVWEAFSHASRSRLRWMRWCDAQSAALTLLTCLTPLVVAKESVIGGHPTTAYGFLFPLYLVHMLLYWLGALWTAFWGCRVVKSRVVRDQLTLMGVGMLATGVVTFIANALLPYFFGDFRFCDLGALAAVFFLLAVAYATLVLRLFNLHIFVRRTLVHGVLLALVLGVYSSTVFLLTQYLTDSAARLTQFVVLVIAFSFDPLRRFLEKKVDCWVFDPDGGADSARRTLSRNKADTLQKIALLFPWR